MSRGPAPCDCVAYPLQLCSGYFFVVKVQQTLLTIINVLYHMHVFASIFDFALAHSCVMRLRRIAGCDLAPCDCVA